jgi:tryptophanyl-tRNA synthetase
MDTVLSGIRSTGNLHLGNYFGAVKNFVKMQHENRCFFFVADYHALTTHPTPENLHQQHQDRDCPNTWQPDWTRKWPPCISRVMCPRLSELYLLLNMNAYVGELERTTTFKEKISKQPENINAGLLTYPVLMCADIIIHNADKVPVGKDQEQNLEMARKFARRFNHMYGVEYFTLPEPYNFGEELVKVPGLDGTGKMGKSEGNGSTWPMNRR